MKAVILKDEDGIELMERLELTKLRKAYQEPKENQQVTRELHRAFHFQVSEWLREHGFSLNR